MAIGRKRIVVSILIILVFAAGGVAYVRYWNQDSGSPHALLLYGNVDIRQVDLAFNLDGKIDAMLVEEGAAVARRQVLARLDGARYRAAVDAAVASVQSHRAVLARLEAGSRPEEIEKARADVQAAEGIWKTAQATLERQRKLAMDRFASQQALDEARGAEQEARGRLDALNQTLALAIAGARMEDIAEAKANLGAARAELALAESRLMDTVIYSPAEGIILARIQEPGAVILQNTPVYTLALSDPVWVRTYVAEPDLGRVYPGMKAKIFTDSAPDESYDGWVGFISPTAEFTPKTVQTTETRTNLVYRVRVYADNRNRVLRQGMPVTVRLIEQANGDDASTMAAPNE